MRTDETTHAVAVAIEPHGARSVDTAVERVCGELFNRGRQMAGHGSSFASARPTRPVSAGHTGKHTNVTHLEVPRRVSVHMREARANFRSARVLLFFSRHHVPVLSWLAQTVFNSRIGCELPQDLRVPHPFGIVVHPEVALGERVTIMEQVAIKADEDDPTAVPEIGNDVFLGAGCRVIGNVHVGDGAVIGANALVTCDVPAGATVVGTNRIVHSSARDAARGPAHGRTVEAGFGAPAYARSG
jgi:serine O-acetyltransferase